MHESKILQIFIVIFLVILIYYFSQISKSEAIYVKSNLDNKEYLVQNMENKEEAAYILSIINKRIFILKDYFEKNMDRRFGIVLTIPNPAESTYRVDKFPEFRKYIEQFCSRINGLVLLENAPDGKYTSYTVNKGHEIALCLRSKKTGELHDINLVMYVVLHELSHVACPEIGHTNLFKKIFIFFLEIAITLKIYEKMDYQKEPQEYCGLHINENLLTDFNSN
jgi:hypothetical protein